MISVAMGSINQMHEKEAQLLRDGYTQVLGPALGPMEYCRKPEYNGTEWGFKLSWNNPGPGPQAKISPKASERAN